jgi:molybdopterin converting factor small subunit
MASKNPIVYLIKLVSKKMQKEINEETSDVYRKKLDIREQNLQAIYQSDENREKMKKIREKFADLKEKKEKYEKAKKGESIYDKMVKFLKGLKAALDTQDKVQTANPVTGPAVIAGKITAFIQKQKDELDYIRTVAGTQKKYIKEDLKLYGEALQALIDEINKGDDEYRQEILSKLDPWAQQDPYIADAPYIEIMPRYQERLGSAEVKAAKDQAADGKKLDPNLFKMKELQIRTPSPNLLMELFPIETSTTNVGDNVNTDDAKKQQEKTDYEALEARLAQEMKNNPDDVYYSGTGTQAEKKARFDALKGKVLSRKNPFEDLSTSVGDNN